DDLIKFLPDLGPCHSKDGPVQKYVLTTGQLRMKPRTHFEQARDTSPGSHSASSRLRDATKDLQKRAFASTVASDDAKNLTLLDLEVNVPQRPEFFDLVALNDLPAVQHV